MQKIARPELISAKNVERKAKLYIFIHHTFLLVDLSKTRTEDSFEWNAIKRAA